MANRIKDFSTTATSAAADDYIVLDGATNSTRKMLLSALGGINSITAASATNLVLNGGATSGNVVINTNGSTLAATFSGANTTLAGNLSLAATKTITTDGVFSNVGRDLQLGTGAFGAAITVPNNTGNVGVAGNLTVSGAGGIAVAGSAALSGYSTFNSGNLSSVTSLNPGVLVYSGVGGTSQYGMDLGHNGSTFRTRIFSPGDVAISNVNAPPTGQSSFTDKFTFSTITGDFVASGTVLATRFDRTGASVGTDLAVLLAVSGDSNQRFVARASGAMEWGPGNAATDTFLSRSGVGTLALSSGTALQLGNAYAAGVVAATGTVDIKDSTGTTYHVLVHT